MSAETEVSKEVVANAIGGNCGLKMSSSQDLYRSDCSGTSHSDQVSDPDNSYLFVTRADGLSDDPVDGKEEGIVAITASDPSVETGAAVEVQNRKLDVLNGQEVSESAVDVKIGYEGTNEVTSIVNGVGIVPEKERFPKDGKGGQVTVADAPIEQEGKIESCAISEIKPVDDSNGKLENVARADIETFTNQKVKLENVVESEIKQVESPSGILEGTVVTEMEVVSDLNGNVGNVEVTEIKLVEGPSERIEDSEGAEIRKGDRHNRNLQDEAKSEIKQVDYSIETPEKVSDQNGTVGNVEVTEIKLTEDPNERIEVPEGTEIRKDNGNLQDGAKTEINQVEDPIGTLDSSEGSDMVTDSNGSLENVADDEIEQVENSDKRLERSGRAEIEMARDQNKEIECAAETDIKQVDVPNEMPESSAVSETEQVSDQKIDCAAETELETLEDQIKPESSTAPIEDVESQVEDRVLLVKPEENCELSNSSLGISESGNEKDDNEYQNNFDSTKTSEICQGSQSAAEDPVDPDLQEVNSKGKNEIKLAKEGVETLKHEFLPATSMDTDVVAHSVNNNEETLEDQAIVDLVSDVMENQNHEIVPSIQGALQQVDGAGLVVSGDGGHVETVCEVLEETHEKDILVSRAEDTFQNDEKHEKSSDGSGEFFEGMLSETETEASLPTQSLPASIAHEPQGEMYNVETTGTVSLSPVDGPQSEIVENDPSDRESQIRCTTINASSESDSVLGMIVGGEAQVETEVSIVKSEVVSGQLASVDVKLESELRDSAARNEELTSDVTDTYRIEVEAGLDVCNKGESDLVLETKDVEGNGDQLDSAKGSTDENLLLQEDEDTANSQGDISVASPEGSSTDAISGKEVTVAAVTKPFNYLIKVPRLNDESLKDRIRHAKLQIEEKTKLRDTIHFQIQQIRANSQIHGVDYEYAKGENRNVRKVVRSKRMEIDSLQSVINRAKNALSIEDIDNRIYSVEHMIQHETVPLKEEKQLIREIKQLKSLRGELSANMGSEEEIKQALEQREEAEERLKILRKELEALKGEVTKTEAAAMNVGMKYEDEHKKVKELQAQFRAANDIRQEAYARWLSLRKELSEKNKHFFKYKDDAAAATNYAFNRDRESIYRLCTDQVENFMDLWNTNDEFRKDYISFNTRSTVRRLGTLDGRSLGPDEEAPILPSYVDERVHRVVSTPAEVDLVSQSLLELKSEVTVENGTLDDKSVKKVSEHKNQTVKTKKLVEPLSSNGLVTFSSWADEADEVQEERVKSMEKIEMDMKAEEMRKKEVEAKLKEQRRLEDLAKANEARERKKRQAEKVQMRAELKARKEAEEKEKEREKRVKKKERKKATATDSNDCNNNSYCAPNSESAVGTGREIDAKDMASVVAKKHQKYTKKKKNSIPPPLRNRNRKKWQHYAYATAAGILVFVLFWVGNIGMFSNKTLKRPNSFY